jgi:dTDP-glucose pyrophosphorylase
MNNFIKNMIQYSANVIDAMQKLNEIPETLTLFVLDENSRMIGTLTDGDIRRGFIKGLSLSDTVTHFMISDFQSIQNGFSINDLKKIRDSGIILLPVLDENQNISKVYDLKKRKSILPMECIIMAGGRGERLRPLTDNIPKPMLPLGGKPIIEHNIDRLISYGIGTVYIAINYLGEQIKDYFGDGSTKGINIKYIEEEKYLGTGGALRLVAEFNSEYILVMNSDLFTDVDFEDLYINTIEDEADIGIASIPYNVKIPYAIFEREESQVISIKEKPSKIHYANAGIYILKNELINSIPENQFYNITDLIQYVLDSKGKVIQNPIYGYWIDIGQPEDYSKAKEIIKHLE